MSTKQIQVPFEMKADGLSDNGRIKGLGSPFGGTPDDGGDIIVKGAFKKSIEKGGRNGTGVVMLSQHGRFDKNPIGTWDSLVETEKGLLVEGQMFIGDVNKLEGTTLANDTYVAAKKGGLRGLSIGWDFPRDNRGLRKPESFDYDSKNNVRYLKEINLWEISPVTFPMATKARITNVKDVQDMSARELEELLRESGGLSKSAAQYVVKLARPVLSESEQAVNSEEVFLKIINQELNKVKTNLKQLKGN